MQAVYNVTKTLTMTEFGDSAYIDVEDLRTQAYASMPASYVVHSLILMLISNTNFDFRFQDLWLHAQFCAELENVRGIGRHAQDR